MIHTEKHQVTELIEVAKECDRCHTKYDVDVEYTETQEFHHIAFIGGYGSIFGDQNQVECDLCQHCLQELIGDICRIV